MIGASSTFDAFLKFQRNVIIQSLVVFKRGKNYCFKNLNIFPLMIFLQMLFLARIVSIQFFSDNDVCSFMFSFSHKNQNETNSNIIEDHSYMVSDKKINIIISPICIFQEVCYLSTTACERKLCLFCKHKLKFPLTQDEYEALKM